MQATFQMGALSLTVEGLGADQQAWIMQIVDLLMEVKRDLNVTRFRFFQLTSASHYRFKIDVSDGRVWNQQVYFDPAGERVTFNFGGEWSVSDTAAIQALRDLALEYKRAGWTSVDAAWS